MTAETVRKCCKHTWKLIFIVLNVIFCLIGFTLLGLGIYLLVTQNEYEFVTETEYASLGVLLLVAGAVTIIIAIVGIIGALGMWPIVLIIYTVVLVIIVLLQLATGILGFVYSDEISDETMDKVLEAISDYRQEGTEGFQSDVNDFIDYMQEEFDCCGYNSSDDWVNTVFFNQTSMFPESCTCSTEREGCMPVVVEGSNATGSGSGSSIQLIWTESCDDSLTDFLEENAIITGAVGIAFGVFEVLGIGIAIGLTIYACIVRCRKDDFDFNKAV